jgi:hypothetical protein
MYAPPCPWAWPCGVVFRSLLSSLRLTALFLTCADLTFWLGYNTLSLADSRGNTVFSANGYSARNQTGYFVPTSALTSTLQCAASTIRIKSLVTTTSAVTCTTNLYRPLCRVDREALKPALETGEQARPRLSKKHDRKPGVMNHSPHDARAALCFWVRTGPINGRRFAYFTQRRNWGRARDACKQLTGGELATFRCGLLS